MKESYSFINQCGRPSSKSIGSEWVQVLISIICILYTQKMVLIFFFTLHIFFIIFNRPNSGLNTRQRENNIIFFSLALLKSLLWIR